MAHATSMFDLTLFNVCLTAVVARRALLLFIRFNETIRFETRSSKRALAFLSESRSFAHVHSRADVQLAQAAHLHNRMYILRCSI